MTDLYKILEISKDASDSEIKKAYHALAKKHHPDIQPGNAKNEQKFKEISQAYNILSNKEKRAQYDRGEIDSQGQEKGFRNPYGQQGGFDFNSGQSPFGNFQSSEMFSHIFDDILKGQGQPQRKRPPREAQKTVSKLHISFIEAAKGCTKTIHCPSGKQVDLKIPAGVTEGQTLRIKNQGNFDPILQKYGDLHVNIHIANDPRFLVKGYDIYSDTTISLSQAIKGGTIRVDTIDGPINLKTAPHQNTDDILRVKNKGLLSPSTKVRGHHFVKLKIKLSNPKDSDLTDFIKQQCKKNKSI